MNEQPALRRTLGFWALLVYGIGDILGAGIYALVGKIAGTAGHLSWLAFLIALGVAMVTALSYAALVRRYPHSGGAAYFCQRAFRRPEPVLLVGWLVFCSGLFSMATLSHAFADYFLSLVGPDAAELSIADSGITMHHVLRWLVIAGFLMAVCWVNFRGIEMSSLANIICTTIEVSGLVIIVGAGTWFLARGGERLEPVGPPPRLEVVEEQATVEAAEDEPAPTNLPHAIVWLAVVQAAALAFYACIGFEDLVNVAEETINPTRNLPLALIAALSCAGIFYLATVLVCTHVISPLVLGASPTPLLDVLGHAAPWFPQGLFALIPLFAVANSALLNAVMASRLLYGVAREGLLPRWLSKVHRRRQTPWIAILVILAVAIVLALSGALVYLAASASALLLAVFLMVHLALLTVKGRELSEQRRETEPAEQPAAAMQIAAWIVPAVGVIATIFLMSFIPRPSLLRAASMVGVGLLIIVVHWTVARPASLHPRA